MITQYYVPGQPQNSGNGGGGYGVFVVAVLAITVIGIAIYYSKSDYKIAMPALDKDADGSKSIKQ